MRAGSTIIIVMYLYDDAQDDDDVCSSYIQFMMNLDILGSTCGQHFGPRVFYLWAHFGPHFGPGGRGVPDVGRALEGPGGALEGPWKGPEGSPGPAWPARPAFPPFPGEKKRVHTPP